MKLWAFFIALSESQCVTKTKSGKSCQRWDRNHPHRPKYRAGKNNCCASPDNDPKGNWCYTTDPKTRFEYCDSEATVADDCFEGVAGNYKGTKSKTESGRICQNWNSNYPHNPQHKPSPSNHNYCRAPDGDSKTWCYTMDSSKRWEYCDVKLCTGPTKPPLTTRRTTTNRVLPSSQTCGQPERDFRWDSKAAKPSTVDNRGNPMSQAPGDAGYIYGGTTVLPQRAPWQVRLQGKFGCGGTLVSLRTIVTAAHCLVGATNPRQWQISAGHVKKNFYQARAEEGWQIKPVEKIIIHPQYNVGKTHNNDIALMILKTPMTYTKFVRPACLPDKNFKMKPGTTALITGWGATERGSTDVLLKNTIPMVDFNTCNRQNYRALTEHMICGGKEGEDTCQGDSGGPLVANVDDPSKPVPVWTLFGVTSWGYGCGQRGKPGVYAEVADYLDWIKPHL